MTQEEEIQHSRNSLKGGDARQESKMEKDGYFQIENETLQFWVINYIILNRRPHKLMFLKVRTKATADSGSFKHRPRNMQ